MRMVRKATGPENVGGWPSCRRMDLW
jgi:hypothetical protein